MIENAADYEEAIQVGCVKSKALILFAGLKYKIVLNSIKLRETTSDERYILLSCGSGMKAIGILN